MEEGDVGEEIVELAPDAPEIQASAADVNDYSEQVEDGMAAMEALVVSYCELEKCRRSGNWSLETISAASADIQAVINRYGTPAMEDEFKSLHTGVSLESYDAVALEGFGSRLIKLLKNNAQEIVVSWKNFYDVIGDFFTSTEKQATTYRSRLEGVKKEYEEKKSGWKETTHHGSLAEMQYFFIRNPKREMGWKKLKDLVADLRTDIKYSNDILSKLPETALKNLQEFSSALNSARFGKESDIKSVVSSFEHQSPVKDLVDKKLIGDYLLFDARSIEYVAKPGHSFKSDLSKKQKLVDLAVSAEYKETKSVLHRAGKVLRGSGIGGALHGLSNRWFSDLEVTTEEIGDVIRIGFQYIDNIDEFGKLQNKYRAQMSSFGKALNKFMDAASEADFDKGVDPDEVADLAHIATTHSTNLRKALLDMQTVEVARALKGAKYCGYMANRLVFNAK